MADFTWMPSYGVTETTTARVKEISFGDGYVQQAADGINTTPRQWSMRFVKRHSDIGAIAAFLASKTGDTFTWDTPWGETVTVRCTAWSRSYDYPNDSSLDVTFTEAF
jgi:phage-related protein